MIKYIFFDLDGTITDPAEGITNSVAYALEQYGIQVTDRSQLNKFIGPPLSQSFEKFYGFSSEKAVQAVEVYREYFSPKGLYENKVYDGIEKLLSQLKAEKYTLVIASSKPKIFVDRILEHFSLMKYFDATFGSELDGTRVKKDEVIRYALDTLGISSADVLMIGDREHDIIGAHKNKITAIGVLYGYGSKKEHENAGADHIANTVQELYDTIKNIKTV